MAEIYLLFFLNLFQVVNFLLHRLHSASCSSTSTQTLFHKNEAAEKEDYIPQNTAFCQQIDPRAYADAQTGPVQNRFLLELLDQILGDENLAPALKFDKLKMVPFIF
jgi:hypothetical protein